MSLVVATEWCPSDIGRGVGSNSAVDDQIDIRLRTKVDGRVGDFVVDRVHLTITRRVSDRIFIDQDPLVDGFDVSVVGHSRTLEVWEVGDVIDRWFPVLEVVTYLMGLLLAVFRVSLIRVVGDNSTVPVQKCARISYATEY